MYKAVVLEQPWMKSMNITSFKPLFQINDNLSAVYLSTNPVLHSRSKHSPSTTTQKISFPSFDWNTTYPSQASGRRHLHQTAISQPVFGTSWQTWYTSFTVHKFERECRAEAYGPQLKYHDRSPLCQESWRPKRSSLCFRK